MKPDALNTVIMARSLLDAAKRLCMVDDKYSASGGLVILQDAVELFFYACLIEKDVSGLENLSFDQLIGELKKSGVHVTKSGTLKAMNKQRVIVKHYGQLAEPTTVRNYLEVSEAAIDDLLKTVFGRTLHEIFLFDLIKGDEIRECLPKAEKAINEGKYFEALVEIRKSIFIEIEEDYSIFRWRDQPSHRPTLNAMQIWALGGLKAPTRCKNKEWIDENVKDPFDYIQIDHERLKIDLLEWGVNTQDCLNLLRLTPSVFREDKEKDWMVEDGIQHLVGAATEQNARYCLYQAYSLLLKKQGHADIRKSLSKEGANWFKLRVKPDQKLYKKASRASEVVKTLEKGKSYSMRGFVPGLSDEGHFASILHIQKNDAGEINDIYHGYAAYDEDVCEIVDSDDEAKKV